MYMMVVVFNEKYCAVELALPARPRDEKAFTIVLPVKIKTAATDA
jgi:hypothetical protein